ALLVGVGLDAPADASSNYEARPEWYFLFLFQLLKFFEGPLTIIGTVVIPGLAFGFLLLLPFVEKKLTPEQRDAGRTGPSRRVLIPYAGMLIAAAALTLWALIGDANNPAFQDARAAADRDAEAAHAMAEEGGIDAAGRIILREGHALYVEYGCAACHDADPPQAPRLTSYGSAEHLSAFLSAPNSPRFFGATALKGQMDPIEVDGEDRVALEAYLRSQAGVSGDPAVLASGHAVFVDACTDCHNDPAASVHDGDAYDIAATGPDLDGLYGFEWTRGLIRNASHPRYYGGALDAKQREAAMPGYPDLDDDALSLITRWLLAGAPGAKAP
ncbi:MAG: cytochrome c5, partial [Myxococcota bacterium]